MPQDNIEDIIDDRKPLKAGKEADFDYFGGMNEVKKRIEPSNRAKVQLTWKNIEISAPPKQGRCGKKIEGAMPKPILRGVSGTVSPGEFLSIIGASGKSFLNIHRCWKDDSVELFVRT
jgi:ABC-type multidrug transport system fused ATPase/permease subunit